LAELSEKPCKRVCFKEPCSIVRGSSRVLNRPKDGILLWILNYTHGFDIEKIQPVPWKIRPEKIVGMQIEILNGEEILVNWSKSRN